MRAFAILVGSMACLTGVFIALDSIWHLGDRMFGNWPPLAFEPKPEVDGLFLAIGLGIAAVSVRFLFAIAKSDAILRSRRNAL